VWHNIYENSASLISAYRKWRKLRFQNLLRGLCQLMQSMQIVRIREVRKIELFYGIFNYFLCASRIKLSNWKNLNITLCIFYYFFLFDKTILKITFLNCIKIKTLFEEFQWYICVYKIWNIFNFQIYYIKLK